MQLKGGLGNQLFQYSLGRCLAIKRNTELKLDLSFYDDTGHPDRLLGHSKYFLNEFDFECSICTPGEKDYLVDRARKFTSRIKRQFNPYHTNLFIEKGIRFDPGIFDLPEDVYLTGWFQSEKYFSDIRPVLKKELIFKNTGYSQNTLLMEQQITAVNSVSVHIRRGDYLKNEENRSYFGILDLTYYANCLTYLTKQIRDAHFFLFSDEPQWVRENFIKGINCTVVDLKESSPVNDMRLMSLCKHHIIANSSYSWWAAWLNKSPAKIVLAPARWFGTSDDQLKDITPTEWIKIPIK